jgi:hypothetical protein
MKGGLGNQLFQFATGLRRVALHLDCLFLNTSFFVQDSRHGGFVLDKLFSGYSFRLTSHRRFNVPTAHLNFDELADTDITDALKLKCPISLSGYFQSYRTVAPVLPYLKNLFALNASGIRTRFDLSTQSANESASLSTPSLQRSSKHTIAVHLRRGDYLTEDVTRLHGIPHLDDVSRALEREIDQAGGVRNVRVVIFTDSKELPHPFNFETYYPLEANNDIERDIEEFVAMSRCNAIICSNSSFSYWAGLLSGSITRQYLPSVWMKSGKVQTINLMGSEKTIIFPVTLV